MRPTSALAVSGRAVCARRTGSTPARQSLHRDASATRRRAVALDTTSCSAIHRTHRGRTLLVLLLGLAWVPRAAHACSCVQVSPTLAYEEHAAVFEGRVLETRVEGSALVAVVAVVQHWKGADQERVEVVTPSEGSLCGVALRVDTSWLIYADAAEGRFSTGLCSRTRLIEEAEEDLAYLGAGVVPVDIGPDDEVEPPAEEPAPRGAGCASCAAVRSRDPSPWGALILAALLARRVRRWRSPRARRATSGGLARAPSRSLRGRAGGR